MLSAESAARRAGVPVPGYRRGDPHRGWFCTAQRSARCSAAHRGCSAAHRGWFWGDPRGVAIRTGVNFGGRNGTRGATLLSLALSLGERMLPLSCVAGASLAMAAATLRAFSWAGFPRRLGWSAFR